MSRERSRNLGLMFLALGLLLCALVIVLVRTMEKRLDSAEDSVHDLSLAYQAVSEGTGEKVPTAEEIVSGIKLPPGIPGENGRDGRDGRDGADGITPACVFTPTQCVGATGQPGATGTDGQDGAPGADGTPGPPGADSTVPGPQGPPGEPVQSFTFEWRGQTWVCADPDGDQQFTCERQGGLLEPAP